MREVTLERNTNETQIELTLNLDGAGRYEVDTGCGFLNHMLELFARHGRFDLVLTCHGDVEVDYHHTAEDIGIALGQAFARALGEYGATSMIAGYTPGRTATIATTVYQLWRTNDEAGAMQWVLVDIVISAVVLLAVNLLERRQKQGGKRA
jgi:imidazoleglycerol phosphate dehydratase HisB